MSTKCYTSGLKHLSLADASSEDRRVYHDTDAPQIGNASLCAIIVTEMYYRSFRRPNMSLLSSTAVTGTSDSGVQTAEPRWCAALQLSVLSHTRLDLYRTTVPLTQHCTCLVCRVVPGDGGMRPTLCAWRTQLPCLDLLVIP